MMTSDKQTKTKTKTAETAETVRLKYVGKKKSLKKVTFKGTVFDFTDRTFEMPAQVAKAFLADGNSKAFKVVED